MRDSMVSAIVARMKEDKNVILLTADLGFQVFEGISKDFPDQYVNVGVAEANMIGVASGLSRSGFTVFCYSMAPFATLRCLEQIKTHLSIGEQNIHILGVGAGYSYGVQGSSHHSIEDFGVMRSMPNISVYTPSDEFEAYDSIYWGSKKKQASYYRLGFCRGKKLHSSKLNVEGIKSYYSLASKNHDSLATQAVIGLGTELIYAKQAIDSQNANIDLFSVLDIKELKTSDFFQNMVKYKKIYVAEQNVSSGGLGEFIKSELYELENRPQIECISLPDLHYHIAGDEMYYLKLANLDSESWVKRFCGNEGGFEKS